MRTRDLRIALVVGALFVTASCDEPKRSPTTPTPLSPTTPAVTSLTISGNTSIGALGTTTQLTAIARCADGTTRDVTADAQWSLRDSDPLTAVVSVISQGLIRADRWGKSVVRVTYGSAPGAGAAEAHVRVARHGVFLVDVGVSDNRWAVEGARVQVTSDAGTFGATTSLWGVVCLPAAGHGMVQIEKAGFLTITKSVTVSSDQTIEFVLQPSDSGA